MIQSILNRELIAGIHDINILLVDKDKEDFIHFLKQLGCRFFYYDDLYFGGNNPHLLLCNNKVEYYNVCRDLSITYHIPSIIVDHVVKNNLLDNDKIKFLDNLPSSMRVAINQSVFKSWHNIHDKVIGYSNNDLDTWKHIILSTSKRKFSL